jgi:hypothetical protein
MAIQIYLIKKGQKKSRQLCHLSSPFLKEIYLTRSNPEQKMGGGKNSASLASFESIKLSNYFK